MKSNYPRKLRVSMACLQLGVYKYLGFSRQVVTKMDGNANYTDPTPTLTDIIAGLDDLQAKADAAVGGGKNAYIVRNMAKEASVMQLRELISYVQMHGQNDPDILTSSGFNLTKTPTPVGPLQAPQNLRASYTGKSGELYLQMNRVAGVTAGYCLQQATSLTGPWSEITNSSRTRNTVTGLTPATIYFFRACGNGAADTKSGWSNVVSIMAV